MANEMLARAADRGDMNQSPSSIASRMYKFYLSQGLPPSAALEQVSRLMSSGMYSDVAERRTGVQDRAMELARRAEDQARMRANPQMLGEGIAAPAPADLPGYDPTAGRMTGAAEAPRLSQPMTRPAPGALPAAVENQVRAFQEERARDLAMRRAAEATVPVGERRPGFQARMAVAAGMQSLDPATRARAEQMYEDQQRRVEQFTANRQRQAFLPGDTSLFGEAPRTDVPTLFPPSPPAGLIGAAAAAPAAAAPAPASAPASAAPPAAAPAAFPMMVAPESMRLPTSYGQPERGAVEVARRVVGADSPPPPPPRPVEISRPAVESPARALWTRYNESESPADFVRADRLGRAEGGGIPEGMMGARPMPSLDLPPMGDMPPLGGMPPASKPAAGTGAGGKDAAINKALEIIHHLVMRGR
jgi:hypothetical protein